MSAARKFIVWDWNGTLLNDTEAVMACNNLILENIGRGPISEDKFREHFIHPTRNFYAALGLSDEELERVMGMERNAFHDAYEAMAAEMSLHAGASEILQELRAHNVLSLIVSNHITGEIRRLLKQHDIEHHFEQVIAYISRGAQFRDMTKGQKLEQYVEENGLNGANALIVGDTMEEVDIARSLGMISVAITGGVHAEHRLRGKKPDYVIHSLHELRPILRERGFLS